MKDRNPFLSIIVRTKNRPALLKEALNSIAIQQWEPLQIIVVNDGGRDVSDVLNNFLDKINIDYISLNKPKGRSVAANKGLYAAKGEWVGLLDDDDLFLPKAFENIFTHLSSFNAEVVYGKVELVGFDESGNFQKFGEFGFPFSRERLFIENYIPTCGLFFKRALAIQIKGFDPKFNILEDWDFIFRLAQKTDFVFIPQFIAQYRLLNRGFVIEKDIDESFFREKFYKKHWKTLSPGFLKKAISQYKNSYEKNFQELHLTKSHLENKIKALLEERKDLLTHIENLKNSLTVQKQNLEGEINNLKLSIESLENSNLILSKILDNITKENFNLKQRLIDIEIEKEKLIEYAASYKSRNRELRKFLNQSYTRENELKLALEREIQIRKDRERIIHDMVHSFSWKSTEPLRRLNLFLRKLRQKKNKKEFLDFKYRPLISVIVPVYNTPKEFLKKCLNSVFSQTYPNWEICIADDNSNKEHVKKILEDAKKRYKDKIKIKYRTTNGHICEATNDALSLAEGEFVAFLDHDDELDKNALFEVVKLLNEFPHADMIYTDEDKITPDGKYKDPYYKPNWAPELFLGQMYTCHLGVYRKKIVEDIGGMRKGFEGAQDYDFVLRFTEKTNNIYHIPKVLYHWRMHEESTAQNQESKMYAFKNGVKAVNEALKRRNTGGYAEMIMPGRHLVHFPLQGNPLISIVIPSKDLALILDRCLKSIYEKTNYSNYEILIVDNGSQEQETWDIYKKWQDIFKEKFRVEPYNIPFNFSKLVNYGVSLARGDIILLLNNDMELIGPENWLQEMGGYAQREEIACVGAILLYPDNTIQHAGVILGIKGSPLCPGVAGHAFKYLPADHPGYFDRMKVVSNYSAVTGACLMVEKKLWYEVDGFDEQLAVAFNDIDFCLKLLEKNYRHVVLPHVRLYHYESKSRGYEDTKEKQKRFQQEINTMRMRWAPILDNDPFYNPNLPLTTENFGLGF